MKQQTDAPAAASGSHPPVETWIAYHSGQLPGEKDSALQDHLAGCAECAAMVLDLEAFTHPEAPDRSGVSSFEKAAVWRTLAPELHRTERWRVPASLAAACLLPVLGLSIWGAAEHRSAKELRQTVAALSRPQVNVQIEDLYPDIATRSGGGPEVGVVPAEAPYITLILNVAEDYDFPDYRVEIAGGGTEFWSREGLAMSDEWNVSVGLPPNFLPAGEYRVRLFGLEDGRKHLLEDYALEVH